MAAVDDGRIREAEKIFTNKAYQPGMAASGKIRSADAALEEGVAGDDDAGFFAVQGPARGRMAGDVDTRIARRPKCCPVAGFERTAQTSSRRSEMTTIPASADQEIQCEARS